MLKILRQFIKYSLTAKANIIEDISALEAIIIMIKPENLRNTEPVLELCIYQFLVQLVKEEIINKAVVGKLIFPVFTDRI